MVLARSERLGRQARISRKARQFDLVALVRLLKRDGFDARDIFIESNPDGGSGATLIERVTFDPGRARRVTIVVNMGLLGSTSPLPSYFLQLIDKAEDPDAYEAFIHYFDNVVLRELVNAIAPDEDVRLWGERDVTKRSYFGMMGVNSVTTLAQIFRWYFPELRSLVRRHAFKRSTAAHAFRTGVSHLDGTGVVGRLYESDAEGFMVELFAEDEVNGTGQAWPHLVRERLEKHVLPRLDVVRMPMTVALTVLTHESWAKLQFEGYLGWERVVADSEGGHRMLIFSGFTGIAAAGREAHVHS